MRFALLLCLAACGSYTPPSECTKTGCPTGKKCNPNTGLCLAASAGGGQGGGASSGGGQGGAGGGSTGSGGGSAGGTGGGQGGGGASASIRVQLTWEAQFCSATTCADCTKSAIVAPQGPAALVPFNTYESWKPVRYNGCVFEPPTADSIYVIDCTSNCIEGTEQCTTPTGPVTRKKYTCYPPDGTSGFTWTP